MKGILGQISTGEGKSLIIAILAVIMNLLGYTVDVVTSSKVLAERDAKEFNVFYNNYFDIDSTNICDDDCEKSLAVRK